MDLLRNQEDSLSSLFELIGLDLCKSLAEDDAMAVIFGHELLLKMLHEMHSNLFEPYYCWLVMGCDDNTNS